VACNGMYGLCFARRSMLGFSRAKGCVHLKERCDDARRNVSCIKEGRAYAG